MLDEDAGQNVSVQSPSALDTLLGFNTHPRLLDEQFSQRSMVLFPQLAR